MQIIFLSQTQTILIDLVAWAIFHLSIGFWSSRIPVERFDLEVWLFRTRKWEQDGEIYQKIFRVKSWKRFIPSGAALYDGAYQIKHISEFSLENVKLWLRESCRSEFCHIMMMFPGFLFYLWNSFEVGCWMLAYAFLNNIVPIILQRYNRPRVQRLIQIMENQALAEKNFDPTVAVSA